MKSSGKTVELTVDDTCEYLKSLGVRDNVFAQIMTKALILLAYLLDEKYYCTFAMTFYVIFRAILPSLRGLFEEWHNCYVAVNYL